MGRGRGEICTGTYRYSTYMRCKRVERVNLSEKVENGENGERGEKCKRVERGEKSERWRRERCDMSSVLNFFNNSVSSCTIFFPCGAKSCHRFFNSLTHHTIPAPLVAL